ncbi:MAG: LysR family transcriptional regulator, partial [Erysipelotrichia bacterium]|nr:LysR family transcriptional regulator [Erysipelotrichia bacterium]
YISQATASNRIKSLEDKLGIELFYRSKGQRTLELTSYGVKFFSIAQQCISLWNEAASIKLALPKEEITVSATDIINRFIFADFYLSFIETNPKYYLTIKTHHASETFRKIDQQTYDIGFCSNLYYYPNIETILFFQEPMVLFLHNNNPYLSSHDIFDLDPAQEIYLPYFHEFETWHKRLFKHQLHPYATVPTSTMQIDFLQRETQWCFIPESISRIALNNKKNFTCCYFIPDEDIPKRNIYLLYNRNARIQTKEKIKDFVSQMTLHIEKDEYLKRYNIITPKII